MTAPSGILAADTVGMTWADIPEFVPSSEVESIGVLSGLRVRPTVANQVAADTVVSLLVAHPKPAAAPRVPSVIQAPQGLKAVAEVASLFAEQIAGMDDVVEIYTAKPPSVTLSILQLESLAAFSSLPKQTDQLSTNLLDTQSIVVEWK